MPTKGLKHYKQNTFKNYFDFDGKRYELHGIRNTESGTEKLVESFRKRGYLARSLQLFTGVRKWGVYVRSNK